MKTRPYKLLGVLAILFAPVTMANAQTAVTYRFLEVVDVNGKPVADATVETVGSISSRVQTDSTGVARLEVWMGDFTTTGFKVSRAGYVPSEDMGELQRVHLPPDVWSDLFNASDHQRFRLVGDAHSSARSNAVTPIR
jgi:hypothetical protein